MLTIAPPSVITAAASRVIAATPTAFTRNISVELIVADRRERATGWMPALLTRTSSRPNVSTAAAQIARASRWTSPTPRAAPARRAAARAPPGSRARARRSTLPPRAAAARSRRRCSRSRRDERDAAGQVEQAGRPEAGTADTAATLPVASPHRPGGETADRALRHDPAAGRGNALRRDLQERGGRRSREARRAPPASASSATTRRAARSSIASPSTRSGTSTRATRCGSCCCTLTAPTRRSSSAATCSRAAPCSTSFPRACGRRASSSRAGRGRSSAARWRPVHAGVLRGRARGRAAADASRPRRRHRAARRCRRASRRRCPAADSGNGLCNTGSRCGSSPRCSYRLVAARSLSPPPLPAAGPLTAAQYRAQANASRTRLAEQGGRAAGDRHPGADPDLARRLHPAGVGHRRRDPRASAA